MMLYPIYYWLLVIENITWGNSNKQYYCEYAY